MDPLFRVEVLSKTENPQRLIYAGMHQDYSCNYVADEKLPGEQKAGEIAVERLLKGGRGHYGCYSSDTEVLTDRGWLFWPYVNALLEAKTPLKLLAVNVKTTACHFETPAATQVLDFSQEDLMYSLSSQYLNFAVTPDHRMVVSCLKSSGGWSEWNFKSASEIYGKPVRYLLGSNLEDSDREIPLILPFNISLVNAFKLAGFFFGDGLRSNNLKPRCIRFRLRKSRKIIYLHSLGLEVMPRKGDRYVIEDAGLSSWIHSNFSSDSGKVIPIWLLKLPKSLVLAFFDGLKNSDGTCVRETSWSYDSSDKPQLDIIQAMAHINGFGANMFLNHPNEGEKHENHRPCWRITISNRLTRRVETCQKNRSPGIVESWDKYQGKVYCATVSTGALMVRRNNKVMVSGNCIESPAISFAIGYFPHSTMQQVRTHRVAVSVDCQSFRYTSDQIIKAADGFDENNYSEVEKAFYLRPVGHYMDRKGTKYEYTQTMRQHHLELCWKAAYEYKHALLAGLSEEHARGIIPFDVRQHWVMSFNARSLMHLLDLRAKADAQLECQQLCELIWPHFEAWMPAIAGWYKQNRWKKARLAP